MMNNMYQGYPNNAYGYYTQPAAQPQQPQGASNWLSADQIARLKKDNSQFSLSVSDEDLLRAKCNHHNADGSPAVLQTPDGEYTCAICGDTFSFHENDGMDDIDSVTNAVRLIMDYMNVCKFSYASLSPEAAQTYFQVIPFIRKLPALYTQALKDAQNHNSVMNYNMGFNGTPNVFAKFAALTNPQMGMMYPQPNMYQQPMGYQQPMNGMNPMYAQPQQPVMNTNMPQQQTTYQPVNNGYAFSPNGAAQPQQPVTNQQPAQKPADPAVTVPQDFKK